MHIALPIFLLVATTISVSVLARRVGLSAPLLLVAIGAVASYLPQVPEVHVDSEVILLGFLPPLLYATAIRTSIIDLKRDVFQIVQLSILLVLVTAFAVGLVSWWLMPVGFAAAMALGGVVAPPDAVAATAVARRIGLPRRLVAILEGESLFNDATALVTVGTAVSALTGSFSASRAGLAFVIAALGGIVIGVIAFYVIEFVQKHIRDAVTSVAISIITPWVAYLPAEAIKASGVIAVVVTGVLLGFKAPYYNTAQARVASRMNWNSIQFLLENMVFLLIGLQVSMIIDQVQTSDLGLERTSLYAVAVLVTVMLVRPMFIIAATWLGKVSRWDSRPLSLREGAVAGWAGMRGVVTLAAAFLLPPETPHRESLVFIALVVTIGTLVIQGFTLGRVANLMKLRAPDPREDALARAQVTQASVDAGEAAMRKALADDPELADTPEPIIKSLQKQGMRRANLQWELLGNNDTMGPTQQYRILRQKMIDAEREKALEMRNEGRVDHEVIDSIMMQLDIEESMIVTAEERDAGLRDAGPLLTPEVRQGGCEHLEKAARDDASPQSHDGCQGCLEEGRTWLHLRMCTECGYVGCCDSSAGQHATKHFRATGHPVMRSFEAGEEWRWCFVDNLPG
ncbi:Na+/H+ antiporter [Dermacoccus nishinomiyaensis]|uniref:Na+/H+ antiporter n=1 Tax=Dermacoccus nishinomiyaensis TaxID=1274 RepID=UPI0011A7207B|nr:Na+/H+ antiporter [Dermacoccus nishinomiyaensis]MCG7429535.1 Na+/H+ antiporter [Dermacoccus nishinomiyaensis]